MISSTCTVSGGVEKSCLWTEKPEIRDDLRSTRRWTFHSLKLWTQEDNVPVYRVRGQQTNDSVNEDVQPDQGDPTVFLQEVKHWSKQEKCPLIHSPLL